MSLLYPEDAGEGLDDGELRAGVVSVGRLEFGRLAIPPYQRPYKWTAKNVNRLISDLVEFKGASRYRLGTLVLHASGERSYIVDGQQRLVTLALLLSYLAERYGTEARFRKYADFFDGVRRFCSDTEFTNPYSLHNVVENMNVVRTREHDLDADTLEFVLSRCEFVEVRLANISEAFQFFDSQNARGKDLAPHDLLKAFHLREMEVFSDADTRNFDRWQNLDTADLNALFLCLFRAKRWSQGKSARYFTKDDIGAFKGISLTGGKRYPFYRLEIIAHVYTAHYMSAPDRLIDSNVLEYPFNLDDQIINGSRFFDMIRYYSEMLGRLKAKGTYGTFPRALEIMELTRNYDGCGRTGDRYVAALFRTLLLYYVDRFGYEELDKVVPKFFVWAYTLRLESKAVQLPSIDRYAAAGDSMFRAVHDACTPYDIINLSQRCLPEAYCTRCGQIKEKFRELKKLQSQD